MCADQRNFLADCVVLEVNLGIGDYVSRSLAYKSGPRHVRFYDPWTAPCTVALVRPCSEFL